MFPQNKSCEMNPSSSTSLDVLASAMSRLTEVDDSITELLSPIIVVVQGILQPLEGTRFDSLEKNKAFAAQVQWLIKSQGELPRPLRRPKDSETHTGQIGNIGWVANTDRKPRMATTSTPLQQFAGSASFPVCAGCLTTTAQKKLACISSPSQIEARSIR
jgi:hypothetical protein